MTSRPDERISGFADSLSAHSIGLLSACDQQGAPQPEDPRDLQVRQVFKRCAELSRGCANLGQTNNFTCLAIISRALFENLILILWVVIKEENAVDLKSAAIAELTRVGRINLESKKARIVNRVTGTDATAEILADDRFKKPSKRKSVEERAKEAGIHDMYNVFYRFLSLDTHGHDLAHTDSSTINWDLSVMHMQGIEAMLTAVARAGRLWLLNRQRLSNDELRKLLGLA